MARKTGNSRDFERWYREQGKEMIRSETVKNEKGRSSLNNEDNRFEFEKYLKNSGIRSIRKIVNSKGREIERIHPGRMGIETVQLEQSEAEKRRKINKYEDALRLYQEENKVDSRSLKRREGISDHSRIRSTTEEDRKNFTPFTDESAYKKTREGVYAKEHPFLGTLGYVTTGIGSGIEGIINVPEQLITGKKLDPFRTKNAFRKQAYAEGIKRRVQDTFGGKENGISTKGENITGFLSDVGLSTVDSAARIAVGAITGVPALGIMASDAANSTLANLNQNEKLSAEQAALGATTHGAVEALTERFSLENLKAFKNLGAKNIKSLFKAVGKQMITEGSEEMVSEIGNSFIDRATLRTEAEFNKNVENYMNGGMSKRAAKNQAYIDLGKSTLLAGLGGAISGGFLGGGTTALNYAGKSAAGKNGFLSHYNTADDYKLIAESVSDETKAGKKTVETARDYENRIRSGERITDAEKAELESLMHETTKEENIKYGTGQYDVIAASIDTNRDDYADRNAYDRAVSAQMAAETLAAKEADGKEVTAFEKSALRQLMDEAGGLIPAEAHYMEAVWDAEPVEEVQTEPLRAEETERAPVAAAAAMVNPPNLLYERAGARSLEVVNVDGLINDIASNYAENGSQAFKMNYDTDMGIRNYSQAFSQIYNAARYGLKQGEMNTAVTSMLDSRALENIFKSGVRDRQQLDKQLMAGGSYKIRQEQRSGGLVDRVQETPKSLSKVLDTLGKNTGIQFIVTNTARYNGMYQEGDGVVVVDLSAANPLSAVSHEMTHWMREYNAEGYLNFRDAAVNALIRNGMDIEEEIEKYRDAYRGQQGQELSREDAIEEVVADSTGMFLNDEQFIRETVQGNPTMAQRVVEWLKSVCDALKELISDRGLSRAARYMAKDLATYERARDLWMKELETTKDAFELFEPDNEKKEGDKFKIAEPSEATAEKMEENYKTVARMNPVLHLTGNEFMEYSDTSKLAVDEQEYLKSKSNGGVYKHPVVGNIEIVRKGVKSDIAHGVGWVKRITIAAIPDTLENGKLLQIDRNWKSRGYDSLALGNKVAIDGGENAGDYFVVAVLRSGSDYNHFYLHEAQIIKTDAGRVFKSNLGANTSVSATAKRPLLSNIFDKLQNYNSYDEKLIAEVAPAQQGRSNLTGIKLSLDLQDNVEQTKDLITEERLEENYDYVRNMKPVYALTGKEFMKVEGASLDTRINEEYRKIGNMAVNPIVGEIKLNKPAIRDSMNHALGSRFRVAAFAAVPDVIENGKVLSYIENWKETPEDDRVVIGAKVTYDGKNAYEIVVAKVKTRTNTLYLQDVLLQKENSGSRSAAADNSQPVTDTGFLEFSYANIFKKLLDVNALAPNYRNIMVFAADYDYRKSREKFRQEHPGERQSYTLINRTPERLNKIFRKGNRKNKANAGVAPKDGAPELKEALHSAGMTTLEYDSEVEGDRLKKLQSVENVRFSLTISEDGETLYDQNEREIPLIKMGLVTEGDLQKDNLAETRKVIRNLLRELSGEEVEIKSDSRIVTFNSRTAREYINSNSTKRLKTEGRRTKFSAIEKIKEIVANASDPRWEENNEEKHVLDARRGWTKYKVVFGTESDGETRVFNGELKVKMSEDGKDYVYDVAQIKEAVAHHVTENIPTHKVVLPASKEGPTRQIRDFRPSNDKLRQPSFDKSIAPTEGGSKRELFYQLDISEEDMPREDLLAENEDLRRANEYLTGMLNSYKNFAPSKKDIRKVVKDLADEFHFNGDLKPFEDKVGRFYTYLRTARGINGEEVTRVAAALANEIVEKAEHTDPGQEKVWKDFKKTMRMTRIYIPDSNVSDYAPDGWNRFRKEWFGKIVFTKDKEYSDGTYDGAAVYRRLQQQFPDYFTASADDMTDDEAIHQIMAAFDLQRPMAKPVYLGADRDQVALLLGQRIIEAYANVGDQDVRTQYNKSYKEIERKIAKKIKEDYIKELEAQRIENAEELRKLNGRLQRKEIGLNAYVVERKALTDYAQQEKQAAARRWRKTRTEYEDSQKKSAYKREIIWNAEKLTRVINQPTDKAHVPLFMLNDLKEVVDHISFTLSPQRKDGQLKQWAQEGTTPRLMKSGAELKAAFARVTDGLQQISDNGSIYRDQSGTEYYVVVDPDIITCLKQIPDMLTEEGAAAENLDQLSAYQLSLIRDTMAALNKMVEVAGRFIANEHYKNVNEAAERTIEELSKRKEAVNIHGKIAGGMQAMFRAGMVDAYTYFDIMGDSGKAIYDEVRRALDKKIRNTRTAQDYMMEVREREGITDREISSWSRELKEIELVTRDRDGKHRKKIAQVTDAQIMSLYLLNKRGQARMHIYGDTKNASTGGVKFAAVKGGLLRETDSVTVYKMDEVTVNRLIGQLSKKQRAVADAVGHFLTDVTSRWGNEVTMTLYGYKKFTASNYFPIDVDDNTIGKDSKALEGSITLLKNMGSTKSVQQKAYNPLILHDIFDVYTEQADKMGSYNAFVVATADMQKWFNYKTEETNIRQEMERALGKDANEYFMNLLRDINGARAKADKYEWSYTLAGNAKAAAIGANLRVVIQQPTAYARAAAEMDVKYLLKGLWMTQNEAAAEWARCKEYAPIAQWKDWGYFDINVGRSVKSLILGNESALEGVKERSMWLAGKMDEVAWVRLWKASQEQVKDTKPELKEGSEEFYQEAGKIFSHIIDTTQVVDSVLHRTDMMKSKSAYVKGITAFLSEPMKNYNMIFRELMRLKNGEKGAREKLARVITVYLISDTLTASAASVMDAVRNADRDKKFIEKWFDAFIGDTLSAFTDTEMAFDERAKLVLLALADKSGVSNIPFVKDIISRLSGYRQNDMTMQGIDSVLNAAKETGKLVSGRSESGPLGYVYKISPVGSLFGIASKNFMKDTGGLLNSFLFPAAQKLGITSENELRYAEKKLMRDVSHKSNRQAFVIEAIRAYADGERELGDRIIRELIEAGTDDEDIWRTISKAMEEEPEYTLAVDAYVDNDMNAYNEYRQQLIDSGYGEDLVDRKLDSGTDAAFQNVANYRGIAELYDSGDREAGDKLFRRMVGFKSRKAGNKKEEEEIVKNVKRQIKTKLTEMYREEFRNNPARREDIMDKLYRIGIEGEQLYKDGDFKKWLK